MTMDPVKSFHFILGKIERTPFLLIGVLTLSLLSVVAGCGDVYEEDEFGTIGTGVMLDGTVSDTLLTNNSILEVYSSDGQRGQIPIGSNGAFETNQLPGAGPWLLIAQVNVNRKLLGMAYSDGTRNINVFTDVSLRRWFAQRSIEIENVTAESVANIELPTSAEYDTAVASIVQLIDLVFDTYQISGNDVISTRYITDDTGVDAFLKRNTVLIDNDQIIFQVTDPNTGLKSESRSATALSADSSDSGNGPTRPSAIRALDGGMRDIFLVWEPSMDDVAVAGYVVLRDGVLLDTTPYPQFIDTNLEIDRIYSYVITAIDSAGNSSDPSAAILGSASEQTVVPAAPQPPTNLTILSSSNSTTRLGWSQLNDDDVASYNVYRGVETSSPSILHSVSVTSTVDTAVVTNQSYCYQVSAVNAAAQESERSAVMCVNAGEIDGLNNNADLNVDDWLVPDTDIICDNTLTTADVPLGLTTISAGCYFVPQSVTVQPGAILQLDEGVILKFADSTKLLVEGALSVLGSRANPVVFTGTTNVAGSWGGIQFAGSGSSRNVIRGAVVQYGGGGDVSGSVSTRFVDNRLRMDDSMVRFSKGYAVSFNTDGTQIDSFNGNMIFANEDVGVVKVTAVQAFSGNNAYLDNAITELGLTRGQYVNVDIVIPNVGIPIVWAGIEIVGGSLTILPGADIEMLNESLVNIDGTVTIKGEPEQPIFIGGDSTSTLRTWDGIRLSGPGNKLIEHAFISHGGRSGTDTGAIHVDCFGNNAFTATINNTDVSNSGSWGIFVEGNNCTTSIGDTVTYSNNAFGNSNVQ